MFALDKVLTYMKSMNAFETFLLETYEKMCRRGVPQFNIDMTMRLARKTWKHMPLKSKLYYQYQAQRNRNNACRIAKRANSMKKAPKIMARRGDHQPYWCNYNYGFMDNCNNRESVRQPLMMGCVDRQQAYILAHYNNHNAFNNGYNTSCNCGCNKGYGNPYTSQGTTQDMYCAYMNGMYNPINNCIDSRNCRMNFSTNSAPR